MGQRHQLFVIARVQGQYRCVAAFHSQYLYGRLVVHAAARLMRAFLNPFNAAAIATELSTLKLADIDSIEDDMSQEDPTVICPYLTGLFVTSCRVDMDRFQLYRLSLESIHMQPCRFNNDDGYTCFDLTEPGAPGYCFWWSGRGPVSALGYLGQDDSSKPQVDLSAVALLDRHALVDVSALGATFPDEFRHLRGLSVVDDPNVDDIPPAAPTSLSALSVISALRAFLSSDGQELESDDALATLADLIVEQNHLAVLRSELLATRKLNANGMFFLKQLLLAEKTSYIDLTPWLSTSAVVAIPLLGLLDALQHAESLNLSKCSTLTVNILESLVLQLPNLKNVVALACPKLGPLAKVLPLSIYLATPPLLAAVHQSRIKAGFKLSAPECVRWTEKDDPPAGLTVVLFAPPIDMYKMPATPTMTRFGVELAHFGAEGVVRGLAKFVEHIYNPRAQLDWTEIFFEMRAYFHPVGAVEAAVLEDGTPCYTYGALPSLIPTVSFDDTDGLLSTVASAQAAMAGVPRHPGWALVLNSKGTMPFHRYVRPPDAAVGIPDYALERWAFVPGQESVGLQPIESLSVREWVSRLPNRHGRVPESVLSECEGVLARLKVGLRSLPLM